MNNKKKTFRIEGFEDALEAARTCAGSMYCKPVEEKVISPLVGLVLLEYFNK